MPEHIGPYTVVRRLDADARTELFLCRAGETRVVVERPRPELAHDRVFLTRFAVEARRGAQLSHPNLVRVVEVGDEQGMPFVATEYVAGESLARVLMTQRSQRRTPYHGHIAVVLADVCAALEHIHRGGGAHGGVDPRCIVVGFDGRAKVRLVAGGAGTVADDVLAIGHCLYETATGRPATSGAPLQAPSEFMPRFPRELDAIITSALQSDASARPRAGELHARLARFATAGSYASTPLLVSAWLKEMFEADDSSTQPITAWRRPDKPTRPSAYDAALE